MLPLRYQILGHLLVGLIVGYLLSLALVSPVSEIERKSAPFTTQSEMMAVTLLLSRDAPPEIIEVQPLAQGRVSVTLPGDYTLALQNARGETLYELTFPVLYMQPGEPPLPADEVRLILVVPAGKEVARIVVTGPQGSTEYELSD